MDLQALRTATAEEHDRTEAAVSLLGPELTQAQYAAVLSRMYGFVRGWERWAAEQVPAELAPLLAARQRSRLLAEDLAFLGQPLPEAEAELSPGPVSRAAFLGALYVMEGSTLGGQYLAAHLEKHFSFRRGQGNAYFVGYGPSTGSMWNEVRTVLKALPDSEAEEMTAAAREMFTSFRLFMQQPGHGVEPTWNERESTLHV